MFKTPRGLTIRIEIPIGFALLARLWTQEPATDAFRVLKTVEGLEYIPAIFGFVCAFIGLLGGSVWWHLTMGLVVGNLLGMLLTMFGAFVVPGLPSFATWWSVVSGYGVFTAFGVAVAWLLKGWEYAVAWIAGTLVAYVICRLILEPIQMKHYMNKVGSPLSQGEINFFNAYRLHADRLEISRSIEVSPDEIELGDWQRCLDDYTAKYPEAVARFM